MKTWLGVVAAVAVLAVAGAARAELVDKVAAVVNRDIIALSEVQQRASPEMARLGAERRCGASATSSATCMLKPALDQLIGEKLMEAEVQQLGHHVLGPRWKSHVKDVQRQNNITDTAQFEQLLAREGYTLQGLPGVPRKQIARGKLMQMKVARRSRCPRRT